MSTYGIERSRFPRPADVRRALPGTKFPEHRPAGPRGPEGGPSDAVLVARARDGDRGAFEAIYRRYEAPLLSYCRHMLGDRDDAEDALQQVFIRAHRGVVSGTPPRELRPWLYTIARNCCHTAITSRRPTAGLDDHEPSIAGLSDVVRDRADLRELVGDLAGLPEDQRSALLLAELGDLSHEEIAGAIDCPPQKVKALVHQARTTLIAQREARAAPCEEIRMQLSLARGGQLRRGPIRRHLGMCTACRDYAAAVQAQRSSLAAILPVVPTAGFAVRVLGHTAAGAAGSIGGGGLSAAGGTHVGAALAAGVGPGSGVAATVAGISAPVAGISATAAGISATAAGTAGAGAVVAGAAGVSGAGGAGAVLGGGLAAKLAIGGAIAVLASAGAAATLRRPAPIPDRVSTAAVAAQVSKATLHRAARRSPANVTSAVTRRARHHHLITAAATPVKKTIRGEKARRTLTRAAAARRKATRAAAARRKATRAAATRRKATRAAAARRKAAQARNKTAGRGRVNTKRKDSALARTTRPNRTKAKTTHAKTGRAKSAQAKAARARVARARATRAKAARVKAAGSTTAPTKTARAAAKRARIGRTNVLPPTTRLHPRRPKAAAPTVTRQSRLASSAGA
jgi:RNA polymerase sigma factor (sigma-70 family)